jgi:hypothetical protein
MDYPEQAGSYYDKARTYVREAFKPTPPGFRGFAKGVETGYNIGFKGNLPFFLAFGTYAAIKAPTGHKISAFASGGIGFGITAVIGGALGGMVGIPPPIAATIAGVLFQDAVDSNISKIVQGAVDFGSKQRRMNFGGDYRDTQVAYTMRQVAAREMGGSLMNARQWLGAEASFLHQ